MLQNAESKIDTQIQQGQVILKDDSCNIKDLLVQEKISQQQQKALELRKKKEQLQMKLEYLNLQVGNTNKKDADMPASLLHPSVLSKSQHQQIMQKIIKQRHSQVKQRQRYRQSIEKKLAQQQQKSIHEKEEKASKEMQQRRSKIKTKLEQHHFIIQKQLSQQKQRDKKYVELKHKKFLYQKIQQRYLSNVVLPSLDQKKKKLRQIRELSRAFDINDIRSHQEDYLRNRQVSLSQSKSKVKHWNYQPPERTQRAIQKFQQQQQQIKRKLNQKKTYIQQKLLRQESFVNKLKQKYVPKISAKLQEQIEIRNKAKEPRPPVNEKLIGMSYLQEAKKLGRKRYSEDNRETLTRSKDTSSNDLLRPKRSNTNYLISNKNRQQYQEIRRKRIEKLAQSQDGKPHQKIKKLQIQSDRINEQVERKQHLFKYTKDQTVQQQAIDLLLTSIKAKIGIIDVFKKSD